MTVRTPSAALTAALVLATVLTGCSSETETVEKTECLTAVENASKAETDARGSSQTFSTTLTDIATAPSSQFSQVASAGTAWATDLDQMAAAYDTLAPLTIDDFADAAGYVSVLSTAAAERVRTFAAAAQAYSVSVDATTTAALNEATAGISGAPGAISAALDQVATVNGNSADICK